MLYCYFGYTDTVKIILRWNLKHFIVQTVPSEESSAIIWYGKTSHNITDSFVWLNSNAVLYWQKKLSEVYRLLKVSNIYISAFQKEEVPGSLITRESLYCTWFPFLLFPYNLTPHLTQKNTLTYCYTKIISQTVPIMEKPDWYFYCYNEKWLVF